MTCTHTHQTHTHQRAAGGVAPPLETGKVGQLARKEGEGGEDPLLGGGDPLTQLTLMYSEQRILGMYAATDVRSY